AIHRNDQSDGSAEEFEIASILAIARRTVLAGNAERAVEQRADLEAAGFVGLLERGRIDLVFGGLLERGRIDLVFGAPPRADWPARADESVLLDRTSLYRNL